MDAKVIKKGWVAAMQIPSCGIIRMWAVHMGRTPQTPYLFVLIIRSQGDDVGNALPL